VDWSALPGSTAEPLNATGRPHFALVSGPAFAAGLTLATSTLKFFVVLLPAGSVTVNVPECGELPLLSLNV
jgi:hypothetical protein